VDSLGDAKRGSLLYKPCIIPNFETLPLHFIPWHPSPAQHLPRYLRCTSFPFVSCRSFTSSLTTPLGFFSWGTLSPVYHPGHGDATTPFIPRSRSPCHPAHVPRPGPARATCRTPPPAAARLLAQPAPATGPARAWTPQRIPPGSGAYHRPTPFRDRSRQGAMLGYSRLGFPKVLLLLRRDCLPNRLPQRDRPGRIPPGSVAYNRPTPFRDRSRQGTMLGSSRLGFP
jgi:hypothetical protein